MLLKQLVHIRVVCSVFWPNCFCLVLFYLFIGSTLKRLCLGKERSSSNYLIYFLTLCLSYSVLLIFSLPYVCMCTFIFSLWFWHFENVAVVVENVRTLRIVAFIYICCCFAWPCAYTSWLLNIVIACISNISFVLNYSLKSCMLQSFGCYVGEICVTVVAVYTFSLASTKLLGLF